MTYQINCPEAAVLIVLIVCIVGLIGLTVLGEPK